MGPAGNRRVTASPARPTDNTVLTGVSIDDPAVPGAACPQSSLAPGAAETGTGSPLTFTR